MSACQYNEGCLTGNCEFCGQKGDCVLLAILRKVADLETTIEKMAVQKA